jgi:hypothetical protein
MVGLDTTERQLLLGARTVHVADESVEGTAQMKRV